MCLHVELHDVEQSAAVPAAPMAVLLHAGLHVHATGRQQCMYLPHAKD